MNDAKIIDIDRIDAQIEGLKSNWELDCSLIDEDFLIECLEELKHHQKFITPMKPDIEGDGCDDNGNIIYDTWICPRCGKHYEIDYDNYDYCPNCGQCLDLSEVNE